MSENMETFVAEEAVQTPVGAPKKAKKVRKPRSVGFKVLMGFVAWLLCLVMFSTLLTGCILLDLRVMISDTNMINTVITELIMPSSSSKPQTSAPQSGLQLYPVSTSAKPLSNSLPSDAFDADSVDPGLLGPLVDFAYELLQEQFGEENPISKDEVQTFIAESTVSEFIAEKVSGALNDFLNDTSETTITPQEIAGLLRDNADLIQETFNVEIPEETYQQIEEALSQSEIIQQLQDEGFVKVVEDVILSTGGGEGEGEESGIAGEMNQMKETMAQVKAAIAIVRQVTSYETIAILFGAVALIIVLLFFVNGTIPKTLSDVGITATFAGLILSSVNIVFDAGLLTQIPGIPLSTMNIIGALLDSLAVIHYTVLGTGVALIVAAIVTKIIKTVLRKKKAQSQAA